MVFGSITDFSFDSTKSYTKIHEKVEKIEKKGTLPKQKLGPFYFIFPLSFYIKKNYIFAFELNITVMAPKKTVTKKTKRELPPKKRFKYIKGCKELVDDPFNLK